MPSNFHYKQLDIEVEPSIQNVHIASADDNSPQCSGPTHSLRKPYKYSTVSNKPQLPVLILNPQVANHIDRSNPDTLYSLWSVFSKCSHSLDDGKRLENISWRLWNRGLMYDSPSSGDESLSSSNESIMDLCPRLSSSIDSLSTTTSNQKGSDEKLYNPRIPTTVNHTVSALPTPSLDKKRNSTKAAQTDKVKDFIAAFRPVPIQTLKRRQTIQPTHEKPKAVVALQSHSLPNNKINSQAPILSKNNAITTQNETVDVSIKQSSAQSPPAERNSVKSSSVATRSLLETTTEQQQQQTEKNSNSSLNQNLHNTSTQTNSRATKSLFPTKNERKSTSLFPVVKQQVQVQVQSRTANSSSNPTVAKFYTHNETTLSLQGISSDSDSDIDSDSDDEEDSPISFRPEVGDADRKASTTSIVRGFSPSAVSIRAKSSTTLLRQSVKPLTTTTPTATVVTTSTSQNVMAKARPDKVAREKMFFIASSSPESELNSVNSQYSPAKITSPTDQQPHHILSGVVTNRKSTASLFGNEKKKNIVVETDSDDDDFYDDSENDEDDDQYYDDEGWDSVDDESDENSTFSRSVEQPKLAQCRSKLSSLFLNRLPTEDGPSAVASSSSSTASSRVPQSALSIGIGASSSPVSSVSIQNARVPVNEPEIHSPRTTRRNMLNNELSNSVKNQLAWDRRLFKQVTLNRSLSRRHTSMDVAGLSKQNNGDDNSSPEYDFDYHARGW